MLRSLDVYPVSGGPPELLGLGGWGGEPLVVLDLRTVLEGGEPTTSASPSVVVVSTGSDDHPEVVALAVDEALNVVAISHADVTETEGAGPVGGEAELDGRLVRMVRVDRLGSGIG